MHVILAVSEDIHLLSLPCVVRKVFVLIYFFSDVWTWVTKWFWLKSRYRNEKGEQRRKMLRIENTENR